MCSLAQLYFVHHPRRVQRHRLPLWRRQRPRWLWWWWLFTVAATRDPLSFDQCARSLNWSLSSRCLCHQTTSPLFFQKKKQKHKWENNFFWLDAIRLHALNVFFSCDSVRISDLLAPIFHDAVRACTVATLYFFLQDKKTNKSFRNF